MKKLKQSDPKPRLPAEYVRPDLSRTGKVEKMYLIWSRKIFFFFFFFFVFFFFFFFFLYR